MYPETNSGCAGIKLPLPHSDVRWLLLVPFGLELLALVVHDQSSGHAFPGVKQRAREVDVLHLGVLAPARVVGDLLVVVGVHASQSKALVSWGPRNLAMHTSLLGKLDLVGVGLDVVVAIIGVQGCHWRGGARRPGQPVRYYIRTILSDRILSDVVGWDPI